MSSTYLLSFFFFFFFLGGAVKGSHTWIGNIWELGMVVRAYNPSKDPGSKNQNK
jgi:hypothetical protein